MIDDASSSLSSLRGGALRVASGTAAKDRDVADKPELDDDEDETARVWWGVGRVAVRV